MVSGTIKRGTAAEGAAFTDGFSASGESQWSRQAASAAKVRLRSADKPPEPAAPKPKRDRVQMLHENRAALQKLRARVARENVPARIIALKRQIENKLGYIAKLELEG